MLAFVAYHLRRRTPPKGIPAAITIFDSSAAPSLKAQQRPTPGAGVHAPGHLERGAR